MPQTLVIGGTGMLEGLCLALAARGHTLSVVARRHARLAALAVSAPAGGIHPVPGDYTNFPDLAARLRAAATARGPIGTAILWIHHDEAPEAPLQIAEFLANTARPVRLFQILGSTSMLRDRDDQFRRMPGILYRRILLGSTADPADPGGRRWLTDEEVCTGALRAIDTDAPDTEVGDPRPWPGPA